MARGVRLSTTSVEPRIAPQPITGGRSGVTAWVGLAALLAIAALVAPAIDASALDWQPARALTQPWRAWTAAAVHYSGLHMAANIAGAVLVAALGAAARVPLSAAVAWLVAWPLTQFGLVLRPDLAHYGGLSGVLHAGAAIVAVHLVLDARGARRAVGIALAAGVVLKVLLEAPWGPALRHPLGWDIATAPFAHATGAAAGAVCAFAARTIARWRRRAVAAADLG